MNEDLFIRLVEAAERIAAALEKMTPVTAGEKVEHVIGYTIGEYKDKEGGSFQPCVFLWHGPPLKYAIATVYPEKFDQLPFKVGKAEWMGGPLDEELARLKNVFHKWEADILLTPKMEGEEPKRTEGGNVVYKFAGVKGYKPVDPAATIAPMTPHQKLVTEFDQLGMQLYVTNWPEVRMHNTKRISKGLMDDAASLTDEHLQRLIDGLKSVIAKGK